jgi:hypothetical protein
MCHILISSYNFIWFRLHINVPFLCWCSGFSFIVGFSLVFRKCCRLEFQFSVFVESVFILFFVLSVILEAHSQCPIVEFMVSIVVIFVL